MAEGFKVEGLRELLSALRKIDPELKLEIKEANREAAQLVYKTALPKVPVGHDRKGHKAGTLRRSVRVLASQRRGQVAAGRASVPYAGVIHFGWPARHIRPQPFLYDALDARRSQVRRIYERRVAKVIGRAKGLQK